MNEFFMKAALNEAKKAFLEDEVPVGAVVVRGDKIIAKAHNQRERKNVATHHAELLAIEKACKKLNSWRLDDCDLYVTLEPCIMCAGAIINARIKKVYYGAKEPKGGACESKFSLLSSGVLNWQTDYEGGVMEKECSFLITDFFKAKREKAKPPQEKSSDSLENI